MSQPPRKRPPAPQGQNRSQSERRSSDYYDEPPPRRQSGSYPQQRSRYNGPPQRGGAYYQQRPRAVQPQRDPFPYVMGGLIGAMVVGLMLVIFLIVSNNNNQPGTTVSPGTTSAPNTSGQTTGEQPPRMSIDEFHALYANPATRPMIIDVRADQSYNEGHIAGALSMPEADIDVLYPKIPTDKLVIAYCQWPAENESARVAQKLHDQYNYSYDNLKVLLGGWTTWKERNGTDPAGYPIETGGTTGDGSVPSQPITPNIVITP